MPARRPFRRTLVAAALLLASLSCSSPSEPAEPAEITLTAGATALDAIGATRTVTATVRDQRAKVMRDVTGIVWSTNAPAVAIVSGAGLVTATGVGTAAITATLGDVFATANITVTPVPVAPVIVGGNFQSATVGTALPQPVQVRVEDRLGTPMAGRAITFAVTSGAGSLGTTDAVSDANGLAQTTWTLGNSTAPLQRLGVTVQGVGAATVVSAIALAGPAAQLRVAPGNLGDGQTGTIGEAVPVRPAVDVRDALGNPVAGATVTFSAQSGGGAVTGGAAVTDNSGVATVGSWILGPTPGVNTLQAALGALTPVVFTANGVGDRCGPDAAIPLVLGETVGGSIAVTDCAMPDQVHYDWYRLDLAARTSVALEMRSGEIDSWLSLYDLATQTLIAENDDIVRATLIDSRIGITLDPGAYLIRARTFGANDFGDYGLIARTAVIGQPATIVADVADGQVAAPGAAVANPPAVRVYDELGTPVAGATVTFATVPGVGSATGTSVLTDANGRAAVGSWTLAAGANVLSATTGSANVVGDPMIFSAKGKASSAGFDINLRFTTMPSATQLAAFSNAAARWEAVITGDVPLQAVDSIAIGECGNRRTIRENVDDVVIMVTLGPIDGPSGILGSAGPCATRAGPSFLPVAGSMEFDTADLGGLGVTGLGDVILHEMGHVLGIGTIWANKGLLQNPSPTSGTGLDTYFSGTNAIAAFNAIGGQAYTGGGKVPVENSAGGAGTRNAHWRESVLQTELMTGFYNGGQVNPLSILTVQSLRDLGYTVSNAAADAFTVTTSLRAEGGSDGPSLWLRDDVRRGPVVALDARGRRVGAAPQRPKPTKAAR